MKNFIIFNLSISVENKWVKPLSGKFFRWINLIRNPCKNFSTLNKAPWGNINMMLVEVGKTTNQPSHINHMGPFFSCCSCCLERQRHVRIFYLYDTPRLGGCLVSSCKLLIWLRHQSSEVATPSKAGTYLPFRGVLPSPQLHYNTDMSHFNSSCSFCTQASSPFPFFLLVTFSSLFILACLPSATMATTKCTYF